jgi:hypothetical protein
LPPLAQRVVPIAELWASWTGTVGKVVAVARRVFEPDENAAYRGALRTLIGVSQFVDAQEMEKSTSASWRTPTGAIDRARLFEGLVRDWDRAVFALNGKEFADPETCLRALETRFSSETSLEIMTLLQQGVLAGVFAKAKSSLENLELGFHLQKDPNARVEFSLQTEPAVQVKASFGMKVFHQDSPKVPLAKVSGAVTVDIDAAGRSSPISSWTVTDVA